MTAALGRFGNEPVMVMGDMLRHISGQEDTVSEHHLGHGRCRALRCPKEILEETGRPRRRVVRLG